MRAALVVLLLGAAARAFACGYCVEDKIAATYDHAVVTQALARQHRVAFFQVDGATPSRAVLERAAYAMPGVDKGSVRVATDLLTVSFAYDPARATLGAIQRRVERSLKGVSLMPLQVMQRPAD